MFKSTTYEISSKKANMLLYPKIKKYISTSSLNKKNHENSTFHFLSSHFASLFASHCLVWITFAASYSSSLMLGSHSVLFCCACNSTLLPLHSHSILLRCASLPLSVATPLFRSTSLHLSLCSHSALLRSQ